MPIPPHKIIQLRIRLSHIEPSIWRRVRVPANYPLRRVHQVIQAAFQWFDMHLHQFEIGGRVYGQPEIEGDVFGGMRIHNDKHVKLGALIGRGIERFLYRYDFGDDWEHVVTIEAVMDPEPGIDYPVLVDGARTAPPEDCGGPPGYALFLEAINDAAHPEHAHYREWYGSDFDPDEIDAPLTEQLLDHIRRSRRKGPAREGRSTRPNREGRD